MSDYNWEEMKNEMAKDKKGGSSKFWSPPSKEEGNFPVRILPPLLKKNEKKFYFSHNTHWINGQSYECLNQTLTDAHGNLHEAEPCPACSLSKKLYNTSERDSDEWKLASSLRSKPRYVYRVVVRGSEDETAPVFYESGKQIFEQLFHIITETDYGVIVDPKKGRDFVITKRGTGRNSRYDTSMPAANTSPIFKDAESFKKVLENAMEMDYSRLIEFIEANAMSRELKAHLGLADDEVSEPEIPVENSKSENKNDDVSAPTEISTISDEEEPEDEGDNIDDILAEFDM
jgi:hypothetical protein